MFIVWKGRGWIVIALLLVGGALFEWLVESQLGVAYQDWPVSAMLAATGVVAGLLGKAWNPARGPAMHSLFWIPLQWWAPLLVLAAAVNLAVRHLSG